MFCSPASAQLPTVELTSLSRSVVSRGSTCTIGAVGTHLDELSRMLIRGDSFTCAAEASSSAPFTSQFQLSVAADCALGLHDVRFLGRFGLSNPRRILVTERPCLIVPDDAAIAADPVALAAGKIYSGRYRSRIPQLFSVHLAAGQTLAVVCYARQLDSPAVPMLTLFDSDHREIGRSRASGVWPAELLHRAQTEGDYLIESRDFLYRGGEGFVYALEMDVDSQEVYDTSLELNQLLRPQPPGNTPLEVQQYAPVPEAPIRISGSLSLESTVTHDFHAAANKSLWIDIESSQADALTDPQLFLYRILHRNTEREKLEWILDRDDPATSGPVQAHWNHCDPSFAWTPKQDGNYRIAIRDNAGAVRPADSCFYRLTIKRPQPAFELLAYHRRSSDPAAPLQPTGINLLRGGTIAIRIAAIRQEGFGAPIEVRLNGAPDSIHCAPAIIAPGASETTLTIEASEDAKPWHGPIALIGRPITATASAEPRTVSAQPITVVRSAQPTHNRAESRAADRMMLCINDQDTAPLSLQLDTSTTIQCKPGAAVAIPVTLRRRDGGRAVCQLRPVLLPPKTSMAEVTIAADKSSGKVELKVAPDAPSGEYTLALNMETKVKWRANPQALERAKQQLARLQAERQTEDDPDIDGAAIKQAMDLIQQLTDASAEREITVWIPSTLARIRITPVQTAAEPQKTVETK